jgi:hypothetical protein
MVGTDGWALFSGCAGAEQILVGHTERMNERVGSVGGMCSAVQVHGEPVQGWLAGYLGLGDGSKGPSLSWVAQVWFDQHMSSCYTYAYIYTHIYTHTMSLYSAGGVSTLVIW